MSATASSRDLSWWDALNDEVDLVQRCTMLNQVEHRAQTKVWSHGSEEVSTEAEHLIWGQ